MFKNKFAVLLVAAVLALFCVLYTKIEQRELRAAFAEAEAKSMVLAEPEKGDADRIIEGFYEGTYDLTSFSLAKRVATPYKSVVEKYYSKLRNHSMIWRLATENPGVAIVFSDKTKLSFKPTASGVVLAVASSGRTYPLHPLVKVGVKRWTFAGDRCFAQTNTGDIVEVGGERSPRLILPEAPMLFGKIVSDNGGRNYYFATISSPGVGTIYSLDEWTGRVETVKRDINNFSEGDLVKYTE